MARPHPLLLVLPLLFACDESANTPDSTQSDASGKADGSSVVSIIETNEALRSTSLKNLLCDEILPSHAWDSIEQRAAFSDGCTSHAFTVTEMTQSTLFGHLDDNRPLTLRMRVLVEFEDLAFGTRLERAYGQFDFRWVASVDTPPGGADRDVFIGNLADDMGEFFRPAGFPENFAESRWDDVPTNVRVAVDGRVAEISDELTQGPDDSSFATLADEHPFEILRDGELVGYVAMVEFVIDHPLFEGAGTTLYLNVLGEVVSEIDWTG